jgi:hypothetical protein
VENVLVAFILIFIILFAALTLSETFLSTQDAIQESWQEMQVRMEDQARTSLLPLEAHTANMGTVIEFALRNNGSARLTDFDRWDVILQYYDAGTPAVYHTTWLPFTDQNPGGGEWTVAGIYLSADTTMEEVYEPGILNPGEEIVLRLRGTVPIGAGTAAQVSVATGNGVGTSIIFMGNLIPVVVSNTGLTLPAGGITVINSAQLETTDGDDSSADLIYTVTTPPAQGTLSLGTTFTQADIDAARLSYHHTGTGVDSFQFTVSDGKDTIGPYTFSITASEPPAVVNHSGLTMLAGSTVTIDSTQLQTTDPDDPADSLVYTVTAAPSQGTLSLGTTFTQADIDEGLLSYAHTGVGSDSFQVVVSDGETIIGPVNFTISVQ